MSAEKMFKELDMYPIEYIDNLFNEKVIEYSDFNKNVYVKFYLTSKFYEVKTKKGFSALIDINLDKAIHKQIKEWKWYE